MSCICRSAAMTTTPLCGGWLTCARACPSGYKYKHDQRARCIRRTCECTQEPTRENCTFSVDFSPCFFFNFCHPAAKRLGYVLVDSVSIYIALNIVSFHNNCAIFGNFGPPKIVLKFPNIDGYS